eukprot:2120065-Amphidinium_carterae.1
MRLAAAAPSTSTSRPCRSQNDCARSKTAMGTKTCLPKVYGSLRLRCELQSPCQRQCSHHKTAAPPKTTQEDA